MATLIGETIGRIMTLLGFDGSDFRPIATDSSGHLQIDALTASLAPDAAKESKQDTQITALQQIDDLQGALASQATDSIRADVLSSALPSGAATEANQATLLASVFGVLQNLSARLFYSNTVTSTGAANTIITGNTVPAGYLYHVTRVVILDETTAPTYVTVQYRIGSTNYRIGYMAGLAANIPHVFDLDIWMEAGEVLRSLVNGSTTGDTLRLTVMGSIMRVA